MSRKFVCTAIFLAVTASVCTPQSGVHGQAIYKLSKGIVSRSVSFENPTGAPGQGGRLASRLGVGRKGSPSRDLKPGELVTLCDIKGPGVIRHIWMTTYAEPWTMRSLVVRGYWDDQEHPSIECPLGDFMGIGNGKVMAYQSAVHSVGSSAGMNIWLPMPFGKRARFTLENQADKKAPLFYQIDYTSGDGVAADDGRLHVLFRRENPTTLTRDFALLPKREGAGRYIGSLMCIRSLDRQNWWGEGEIKVYMDGDKEFPTICGTGSEDYVGLSWGTQQTPYLYNGCNLDKNGFVTMYRWHIPDPIVWHKECRITIQQIGWKEGLYERQDDWSCATFWYEPLPSADLPPLPDLKARSQDLYQEEAK